MTVELRLISIYALICEIFPSLQEDIQRYSNNRHKMPFTDEEVLSIYIFGILQRQFRVKDIHAYIFDHWQSWFPNLPRYEAYNHRLLRLAPMLPNLLTMLAPMLPHDRTRRDSLLIDSMPIILARASRADSAKVAREVADKGYCSSKDLYYHGIKLHAVVERGHQCLPRFAVCDFSAASEHDVGALRRFLDEAYNCHIYGDKAYWYHDRHEQAAEQGVVIEAIEPRVRGRGPLTLFRQVRNSNISRLRQPIESWFAWLQEKTHIEQASKVRSTKGLIIHVLGRIGAALIAQIFNF